MNRRAQAGWIGHSAAGDIISGAVIGRGADEGAHVAQTLAALEKNGLVKTLMIDASHANCAKDCRKMPATYREIVAQRFGENGVIGAMLESNLVAGAQALGEDRAALVYGQSITDQCIDWPATEQLIRETAARG